MIRVATVVVAAFLGGSCAPAEPTTHVPVVDTGPDDIAEARAVTLAWFARWCAFDWREPMNANIERAAVFQTPEGKAADLAAGDDDETYRTMRDQHLSGRCGDLEAVPNQAAPAGPGQVFVIATGQRTLLADAHEVQTETVSTTRRVVFSDGRWLVDKAEEVG